MINIINLTPHSLNFIIGDTDVSIPPSGNIARCKQDIVMLTPISFNNIDIPVGYNTFGDIEGLPQPADNTVYFVSRLVAEAAWAKGRSDVFCPLSTVRNSDGVIIGTTGLATKGV